MKIGCLQFAPKIGQVEENIQKADQLLAEAGESCQNLDLLVLPEMAFSGYNFPSLEAITPFLEPTSQGPSTKWAIATARRLNCIVNVGYPEQTSTAFTNEGDSSPMPKNYNTVVSVSPTGQILASYRKSFLYYTDETWATEGDAGFFNGSLGALGQACMGICMDINPRKFEAPWSAYEFATHCVEARTPLVVLSMAWLTRLSPQELAAGRTAPDLATLMYWLERFGPLIERAGEGGGRDVVLVLANRCGMEPGLLAGVSQGKGEDGEEVVSYAGSSCVLRVGAEGVQIFDLLGKAEERLLIVDTSEDPKFALRAKATSDE